MNKIARNLLTGLVGTCALVMATGCASAPKTETVSATAVSAPVADQEQVIVDWSGRSLGAPMVPDWLMDELNGGYAAKNNTADTVYFVVMAEGYDSKDNAIAIAETNIYQNLASQLRITVVSTFENFVNTKGNKQAFTRAVGSSVVDISGWHMEKEFWNKQSSKDKYGRDEYLFNAYALFSCDRSTWEAVCKEYLKTIVKQPGLDKETQAEVANNKEQIYNTLDMTTKAKKAAAEVYKADQAEVATTQTSEAKSADDAYIDSLFD